VGVSAEDRNRSLWANDPLGYDQGLYTPNLGTSVGPSINWRHPYSAGFRPPTSFFDGGPVGSRIEPAGNTGTYLIPGTSVLGPQLMTAVAFPSQKVLLSDSFARHVGPRTPFCTSNESRLPLLMADSSASVRAAAEGNPGCNPNTGQSIALQYTPTLIDPPAAGANAAFMIGRFLWTRQRIGGRDFGGPEVPGF
jgi:hypothetical protein